MPDAAPDSAPGGSAVDAGGSGIKSIDASPADTAAPPTPPPPAAPDPCPADGTLLLCLDFEGAVRDESEPAAAVTARGVAFEAGPSGQAGRLSPASQVLLPSGVGLGGGSFTVEAWLRPDGLPGPGQRAGIVDKDGHFGLFLLPNGDVGCTSQGATATAARAAQAGQWISASCTVGGGMVSVWIGGVQRASRPLATSATPPGPGIAVGSNMPSGDPFSGLLDNVRIWTGARTAAQLCPLAYGCR